MTRFVNLSALQLIVLALLMSLITSVLISINTWWIDTRLLPQVYQDQAGTCIKVVNFENGHAFNCQDVGILLRRYRLVQSAG